MATYIRKFCFELLTPEATVFTADAVSAVIPAADGEIGILGGHAPLLTILGTGKLTVEGDSGEHHQFFVSGGFALVRDNAVSILAEQAQSLHKLDSAAATLELSALEESLGTRPTPEQRESLAAARTKLRLAESKDKG